jgi:hypothetical protein
VIAHQEKSPAGELNPNLVASAGKESYVYKTVSQMAVLQPGFFHSAAGFLYHKYLVLSTVLK